MSNCKNPIFCEDCGERLILGTFSKTYDNCTGEVNTIRLSLICPNYSIPYQYNHNMFVQESSFLGRQKWVDLNQW